MFFARLSPACKVRQFLCNSHTLRGVYNTCITFLSVEGMCEREDYRICCTADTSLDLRTAYDQAAEDFYGTFSGENSSCTGEASTETDEIPTDSCTGETLLDELELGNDDMSCVTVGLDDERRLVDAEVNEGCGCPESCYKQFDEGEIYSVRLNMMELEKVEKDMLVLGKLQVMVRSKDAIWHARKKKQCPTQACYLSLCIR